MTEQEPLPPRDSVSAAVALGAKKKKKKMLVSDGARVH